MNAVVMQRSKAMNSACPVVFEELLAHPVKRYQSESFRKVPLLHLANPMLSNFPVIADTGRYHCQEGKTKSE